MTAHKSGMRPLRLSICGTVGLLAVLLCCGAYLFVRPLLLMRAGLPYAWDVSDGAERAAQWAAVQGARLEDMARRLPLGVGEDAAQKLAREMTGFEVCTFYSADPQFPSVRVEYTGEETPDVPAGAAEDTGILADGYRYTVIKPEELPDGKIRWDEKLLLSVPVMRDGAGPAGTLQAQYPPEELETLLETCPLPLLLIDSQGAVHTGTKRELSALGETENHLDVSTKSNWDKKSVNLGLYEPVDAYLPAAGPVRCYDLSGEGITLFAAPVGDTGWTAAVAADTRSLREPLSWLLLAMAGIVLLAVFVAAVLAFLFTRRWERGLENLRDAAIMLSNGRFAPVPEENGRDALREAADAFNDAIRTQKAQLEEVTAVLSKMARGDFHFTICANYTGDFSALKTAVNDVSAALHSALSQIDSTTRQLHGGSRIIADSSAGLAQGVAAQNRFMASLTRSVKSLEEQLSKNVWRAGKAHRELQDSGYAASIAEREMRLVLSAVQDFGKVAGDMDILRADLDDLCSQAAILAVSAAVESARDMGFGVVAEEMQELSELLEQMNQRLESLSERMNRTAEKGERMGRRAADGMGGLKDKSERAAAAADELLKAADGQEKAARQAVEDVNAVAKAVQDSALIAQQNTFSSRELAVHSQVLTQLVSGFYAQGAVPPKAGKMEGPPPGAGPGR